jgi:hypothetical protein
VSQHRTYCPLPRTQTLRGIVWQFDLPPRTVHRDVRTPAVAALLADHLHKTAGCFPLSSRELSAWLTLAVVRYKSDKICLRSRSSVAATRANHCNLPPSKLAPAVSRMPVPATSASAGSFHAPPLAQRQAPCGGGWASRAPSLCPLPTHAHTRPAPAFHNHPTCRALHRAPPPARSQALPLSHVRPQHMNCRLAACRQLPYRQICTSTLWVLSSACCKWVNPIRRSNPQIRAPAAAHPTPVCFIPEH